MESPVPHCSCGEDVSGRTVCPDGTRRQAGPAGALHHLPVVRRAPRFSVLRHCLLCVASSVRLLRTEPLFLGTAVPLIHGPVRTANGLCWMD